MKPDKAQAWLELAYSQGRAWAQAFSNDLTQSLNLKLELKT